MTEPHPDPSAHHPQPAATSRPAAIGVVAFVLGVVLVVFDFVSVLVNAALINDQNLVGVGVFALVASAIAVVLALTAIAVGLVAAKRPGATRVYGVIGTTVGAMVVLQQFGSLVYTLVLGS